MGNRVGLKSNYGLIVAGPRDVQPRFYTFLYRDDLARRIEHHRQGVYGKDAIKGCVEMVWEVPVGHRGPISRGTVKEVHQLDWTTIKVSNDADDEKAAA